VPASFNNIEQSVASRRSGGPGWRGL